ncbi:hypothetical protein G9A89_020230 [Geosiphon pyriformis]|nr:hypothetical protein G9A89_020230 [Geosiphon pyriformis]
MSDKEGSYYFGYTTLVTYLKEHTDWSYTEFLKLHRDIIIESPPFYDDWTLLDSIWFRRFNRVAQNISPDCYENKGAHGLLSTGLHGYFSAVYPSPSDDAHCLGAHGLLSNGLHGYFSAVYPSTTIVKAQSNAIDDKQLFWENIILHREMCKHITESLDLLGAVENQVVQPSLKRPRFKIKDQGPELTNDEEEPEKDSDEAERIDTIEEEKPIEGAFEWEFDQSPPTWLGKLIEEQKKMIQMDINEYASKPLYWRILDLSSLEVVPKSDQESVRKMISSTLQTEHWEVMQPPAERCLKALMELTTKQLKKIAKIVKPKGICGALLEITNMVMSKKMEDSNPFFIEQKSESSLFQDDDYLDDEVSYILELLRYTYEMIALGIPQRKNSERDIDILINSHIFSCFNDVVDKHLYVCLL